MGWPWWALLVSCAGVKDREDPAPIERCNGIDDDRDDLVDEAMLTYRWVADADAEPAIEPDPSPSMTPDYPSPGSMDLVRGPGVASVDSEYSISQDPSQYGSVTYNEAGKPLTESYGTIESESPWSLSNTYTYDDNQNLSTQTFIQTAEGEEIYNVTYTYTYDDSARLTAREQSSDDTLSARYTYSYDESGFLATVEYDIEGAADDEEDGPDGTPDRIYTYVHDAEGSLVVAVFDDDADGLVDEHDQFYYDATGDMIRREQYEGDDDGAMELVSTISWSYDDEGRVLTTEGYDEAEDAISYVVTRNYDEDGNIAFQETYDAADDEDGDGIGTTKERYFYTYAVAGNLLVLAVDPDADGQVDDEYAYSYGNDGVVETRVLTVDNDQVERIDWFGYDENRDLVKHEIAVEGEVIYEFLYAFTCH